MLLWDERSCQAHYLDGRRSVAVAGSPRGGNSDVAAADKRIHGHSGSTEGNIVPWRMAAWEEPRAVGDLVHVETFFARNLGGLIHARSREPVRLGKATSRTPSMYVDEKSDEAIILAKPLNKGRQLAAEVAEGRASPEGNSGP